MGAAIATIDAIAIIVNRRAKTDMCSISGLASRDGDPPMTAVAQQSASTQRSPPACLLLPTMLTISREGNLLFAWDRHGGRIVPLVGGQADLAGATTVEVAAIRCAAAFEDQVWLV